MSDYRTSRRDVLRVGAGVVAGATVTSTSGCLGEVPTAFSGNGATSEAKRAPEDSQAVLYVNAKAIFENDATEQLANAYFDAASRSRYYSGPTSYRDALSTAEEELGLDPEGLNTAVAFGDYAAVEGSGETYGGVIFGADWSEDDIIDALEDNAAQFSEDEYSGKTIYTSESEYTSTSLGILESNRYVLGVTPAVEDALDVAGGEEDPIDSDLASAFKDSRNGSAIRFAAEVPEDTLPQRIPTGRGDSIDVTPFQSVNHTSGAVYSSGDSVGVELRLVAEDGDAADEVKEQTEALITVAKSLESTTEEAESFLDAIDVEVRSTTNVVLTIEQPVDDLTDSIETVVQRTM